MTEEQDTIAYKVRLAVTARVFAEETFEAANDEAAQQYVEALDPADFDYTYSADDGIEGDEVAFWTRDDDEDLLHETEVVLKADGEPLSWEAVEIVKELAKLHAAPTLDNIEALTVLISRAHLACVQK